MNLLNRPDPTWFDTVRRNSPMSSLFYLLIWLRTRTLLNIIILITHRGMDITSGYTNSFKGSVREKESRVRLNPTQIRVQSLRIFNLYLFDIHYLEFFCYKGTSILVLKSGFCTRIMHHKFFKLSKIYFFFFWVRYLKILSDFSELSPFKELGCFSKCFYLSVKMINSKLWNN